MEKGKSLFVAITILLLLSTITSTATSLKQEEFACPSCNLCGCSSCVKEGCTTGIIGKKATADGSVIMYHTEDYGANDCMHIKYYPRKEHPPGEVIHFKYADVPQVPLTYAYTAHEMYDPERLGFAPAAFMNGINEWGVSMSSNCFSSREPLLPLEGGLSWSEIGQLCMERARTAREAVDIIAWAVDNYHFNGFEDVACKYLTFVVADANEGWIVEVTPRHWVAKRCPDDGAIFYANQAQIDTEWDLACDDLIDYAIAQGWHDPSSGEPFSFKKSYCGPYLGNPRNVMREERQAELLGPKLGSITLQDVIAVMRDHYEGTPYYDVPHNSQYRTICVTGTVATEIYHLRSYMPPAIGCVMWIAASSPCCSVLMPVYAGNRGDPPQEWRTGWDTFDPNSAWWTFEMIQRWVAPRYINTLENWEALYSRVRATWDLMERIEFTQTAHLEKNAMKLWKLGREELALNLLTKYTYNSLHTNYLIARMLLHWVQLNALIPEPGQG